MDKKTADKLLAQTRDNYDDFAESFSRTREYVPENIIELLNNSAGEGDKVLDIGCGNGRFYPFFENLGADYTGVDGSKKLIKIASGKHPKANFIVGNALRLPFAAGQFDLAVSWAVLHHIPSKEHRRKFFHEAYRVLRRRGKFIVAVWDLRPEAMAGQKRWRRLKSFLRSQARIVLGREKMDFGDFFIPWQKEYQRYHHAFSLSELKKLAKGSKFEVKKTGALKSGKNESNLYIIAEKA